MSQRLRAIANTVSDLTSPRFEPQTSRSRDEHVTARPTNWYLGDLRTKTLLRRMLITRTAQYVDANNQQYFVV